MSRGFSLPGLMLALLLGCQCVLMALGRFESQYAGFMALRRAVADQLALRMALFQLARDLRQDGQAGCHALPVGTVPEDTTLSVSWAEHHWQILTVTQDEQGRLTGLTFRRYGAGESDRAALVLSSCARVDVLQAGQDFTLLERETASELCLLDGVDGHHLPSLELGPLVARRYRLAHGQLMRDDTALVPLTALSVSSPSGRLWRLKLTPQGKGARVWELHIARRQAGTAMIVVMVLILAASLLLASAQRLLLDEGRQVWHERQWTQALFRAESALRHAERQVRALALRPGHAAWFQPSCEAPDAPHDWQRGLCLPARLGVAGDLPAWRRGEGDSVLSPCSRRACRQVPLPPDPLRAKKGLGSCGADPRNGPFDPDPCYIVELLDAHYQGAGLYRITVRAWGHTARSSVTLQSYFHAQGTGRRLSWRMLW